MISAVIPVRDGARYLPAAIASLQAQSEPPAEIVVVDDGSRDGSAQAARDAGARVIVQAACGPGAARNAGALAARHDLLAFLDADDLAVRDRLARQRAALAPFDAVFGGLRAFLSPDRPELAGRLEVPPPAAAPHAGTMLIRRAAFLGTGGFDAGLATAEFIEWFDRARAGGLRVHTLTEVVVERRLHGDNLTLHADPAAYAQVARAAILRRRGAA